jgi:hypothetical protein
MAQLTHLRAGDTVVCTSGACEGADAFTALVVVSVDKTAGTAKVKLRDAPSPPEWEVLVSELTPFTI